MLRKKFGWFIPSAFSYIAGLLILASPGLAQAATADLIVNLTTPTSVANGSNFPFQVRLRNGGPDAASIVILQVPKVAGVVFDSATCTSATGGATCPTAAQLASLAGGSSVSFTSPLPAGGEMLLDFSARMAQGPATPASTNLSTTVSSAATDPNPVTNSSRQAITVTYPGQPDIATAISISPAVITDLTKEIVIKASLSNIGTASAFNIETKPDGKLYAALGMKYFGTTTFMTNLREAICTPTGGAVCPTARPTLALNGLLYATYPEVPAGGKLDFTFKVLLN